MKTRCGFVSNSSTSSFVLLGFHVDASRYTAEGLRQQLDCGYKGRNPDLQVYEADDYGSYGDGEDPVPEGKILIGIQPSDLDGSGRNVRPITEVIAKLEALRHSLGLSEDQSKLILFHYLANG